MNNKKNDIRLLFIDVDGTLTNGKIYISDNGELFKAFNVKDGYGIHNILKPYGIIPIIITGRISTILENRCKEIGISELYQEIGDKLSKLKEILTDKGIDYINCAYIGDDINDLECMKVINKHGGLVGCPKDAVHEVIEFADFVSDKNGGEGAVRDFIEWLVKQ